MVRTYVEVGTVFVCARCVVEKIYRFIRVFMVVCSRVYAKQIYVSREWRAISEHIGVPHFTFVSRIYDIRWCSFIAMQTMPTTMRSTPMQPDTPKCSFRNKYANMSVKTGEEYTMAVTTELDLLRKRYMNKMFAKKAVSKEDNAINIVDLQSIFENDSRSALQLNNENIATHTAYTSAVITKTARKSTEPNACFKMTGCSPHKNDTNNAVKTNVISMKKQTYIWMKIMHGPAHVCSIPACSDTTCCPCLFWSNTAKPSTLFAPQPMCYPIYTPYFQVATSSAVAGSTACFGCAPSLFALVVVHVKTTTDSFNFLSCSKDNI